MKKETKKHVAKIRMLEDRVRGLLADQAAAAAPANHGPAKRSNPDEVHNSHQAGQESVRAVYQPKMASPSKRGPAGSSSSPSKSRSGSSSSPVKALGIKNTNRESAAMPPPPVMHTAAEIAASYVKPGLPSRTPEANRTFADKIAAMRDSAATRTPSGAAMPGDDLQGSAARLDAHSQLRARLAARSGGLSRA